MQEKDKHKLYSKEELLKLIKEGRDAPADMDDFDREALEGLKLVTNKDVLNKLNNEVDAIVDEEKKKKRVIYYFSAAASLLLLIGLIFVFKNSFVSKDEKPLALAEKPKEENSVSVASAKQQTETLPAKEDKAPGDKKEEKRANTLYEREVVADAKVTHDEQAGKGYYHEEPIMANKMERKQADDDNKLLDETKPVSKSDATINTSTTVEATLKQNEEQIITANEPTTGNAARSNENPGEKTKQKKNSTKTNQQPSQFAAGLSQATTSTPNSPAENNNADIQEYRKADMLYAKDAEKNKPTKTYKDPVFIDGDTAFTNYTKQNLKISSPNSSGIITVSFIVTKNGAAKKIEVTKPLPDCNTCSDDVINLIKSVKKWQPAVMDGKPIDASKKMNIQYN